MLGQDVAEAARSAGHEAVALGRGELDVTDAEAVAAIAGRVRPEVVVNCAAWTDVDGAESEFEAALAVNGAGAGNVARAAVQVGAWVVHVSTDYVFDGTKRAPYVESDPVAPASAYGRTKLAGEVSVREAAGDRHTIVRSSWLFGAGGGCFPATMLRLAAERDSVTVVDDQVGCPTFTGHLARGLISLAASRPLGVVHVAGAGSCSWFELARETIGAAGLSCEVRPGRTADLGRPAPRPAYSVLGTERGAVVPRLPEWRDGLAEYLTAAVPSL